VGAGVGAGFVATGAAAGAGTRRTAGGLAEALGVTASSNLCQSDGSDLVDAAVAG
jgi:hypothetical protein